MSKRGLGKFLAQNQEKKDRSCFQKYKFGPKVILQFFVGYRWDLHYPPPSCLRWAYGFFSSINSCDICALDSPAQASLGPFVSLRPPPAIPPDTRLLLSQAVSLPPFFPSWQIIFKDFSCTASQLPLALHAALPDPPRTACLGPGTLCATSTRCLQSWSIASFCGIWCCWPPCPWNSLPWLSWPRLS